jgi:DNA-binding transcriptional regulator YhcF (GntR family)
MTVNHEDAKVNVGYQLFECKRGQSIMSLQSWAKRWGVSKDTVRNFFVLLVKDGMINTENMSKTTRLTVCNYDTYQDHLHDRQTITVRSPYDEQTLSHPNNKEEQFYNENNRSYPLQDMSEKDFSAPDVMALDQSSFKASSDKENLVSGASDQPNDQKPAEVKKKGNDVDFNAIVAMYHAECLSFPRIIKLSEARKTKIRIRLDEMKGDLQIIKKVFQKLEESKFCRGDNKTGWKASFDWVFENEKNWVKVYEGNYDNKTRNNVPGRNESVNDIWK